MSYHKTFSLGSFFLLIFCLWGLVSFSACDSKKAEAGAEQPVVRVNHLQLTAQDLRQELRVSQVLDSEKAFEPGTRPAWLDHVIEREILVQEAQRLSLERRDEFMRTIERFWKETLIKLLLLEKGQQISAETRVYEPEIAKRYEEMIQEAAPETIAPLAELRSEIKRNLREEKEDQALEVWIQELRDRSQIEVNEEALRRL